MKQKIIFFLIITTVGILLVSHMENNDDLEILLNNSGPYIGADYPNKFGLDGSGIKIAVIDTGVDYNHPDLLGLGDNGKIIGGYDYVDDDDDPFDDSGHGTEVTGIIVADGQLKGIAPKAKILAYRVSDDGESVSSELIIVAINDAINQQVDIINISLGVNITNSRIDNAVNKAIDHGIFVVTAAGNNGPALSSIGSPGINPNVITVGASYNNITSSLVATLEIQEKQFQILPMVGTKTIEQPIRSDIVFAEYGRERDFAGIDVADSIVLVERGSDVTDEIIYFSEKEYNAAGNGAIALIVYNKQAGIFFGELIHEFASSDYEPSIPTVSMSREEGLALKEIMKNSTDASFDIFYHPDFIAHFSSRGPVSPFYIKPDLVAPGVFVNTTLPNGKYNVTSGTSFAAPHVTGAAALLLQQNPNLKPHELKSILVTTTDEVTDEYGNKYGLKDAGAGRLNVTSALSADIVLIPSQLVFNFSPQKNVQSEFVNMKNIGNDVLDPQVSFENNKQIDFEYEMNNDVLKVIMSNTGEVPGSYEGTVIIENNNVKYRIPVLMHINEGSIDVIENNGEITLQVVSPKDWNYARISLINQDTGTKDVVSATPSKAAMLTVYEPGKYWIESKIDVGVQTLSVYETVYVESVSERIGINIFDALDVPEKPIIIIVVVAIIIGLVGLKIRF